MVIEIILSSIAIVISILGLIFFFIKKKEIKKDLASGNGIFVTNDASSLKTHIVIFTLVNIGLIVLLVTSILKVVSTTDFYLYFVMAILLYGITGHYILTTLLTYVCFYDEVIKVKKLFKKIINVKYEKIKMVGTSPNYIVLSDDNKALLSFTITSNNAKEAVVLLQNKGYKIPRDLLLFYDLITPENNQENQEPIKQEDPVSENKDENEIKENKSDNMLEKYTQKQLDAFELIGKEFRENAVENRKKEFIKSIITQIFLIIVIVVFTLLMQNWFLLIFTFFSIYLIINKNKELNVKYNLEGRTNIELGINYAYDNKKVKGYHELKNKSIKSTSIMLLIFFVIFAGITGYMYLSAQPITYEDMITVNGTLTELKEDTSITIKITDGEEKYSDYSFVIPNGLNSYFESETLLQEEVNQFVEMKVIVDETSKTATVYYVSIGEDVYVNLDTLNSYVEKYKNDMGTIFFVIVGAMVLFIGGVIGLTIYNKKQISTETIDIKAE